ncbi:cell division cycle protein 27 homolog isoform X2 [Watersipora subatra]|uniref:cell division cycle protein 27 homolog isoform X2 n=1 Tax=Watersipora subatra TaxID=2589382 RepID=UPI00355C80B0
MKLTKEAEFVLTHSTNKKSLSTLKDFSDEYGDNASFVIGLLADVCRRTERHEKALEYYQTSLTLNPFMWSSFSSMCKLGGQPNPEKLFQAEQVQQAMNSVKSVLFSPQVTALHMDTPTGEHTNISTPHNLGKSGPLSTSIYSPSLLTESDLASNLDSINFETPSNVNQTQDTPPVGKKLMSANNSSRATPSFGLLPLDSPLPGSCDLDTPTSMLCDMPAAPIKRDKVSKLQTIRASAPVGKLVFGQSSTSNTKSEVILPPPITYRTSLPRRRSKRILDSQNSSNVKENNKVQMRKQTSPRTSARKMRSSQKLEQEVNTKNSYNTIQHPSVVPSETLDFKQKQSANAFLSLLRDLGSAYLASQTFNVRRAVKIYENIPYHQYRTGWVLAEVGKAYLELSEYQKAEEAFKELRMLEPHQVHGMETYSTVLFHLQKEVALSTLAQDMVDIDKSSAQTWCVNGNCFSLQKEHTTAIKFLQRAIQLDPTFAYAYTLLGHEYTLIEDYDKAMAAFRNALRVDTRHYNAWYGLGMIFYKKEKFALAETHFKRALDINPQSAVLLCHVGLVQLALHKNSLALKTLNQAVELSPRNPMCLFHRASMLVANDKLNDALKELDELKALTPKESLVYFLIGKVHKKLGNAHLSMLNFSWATDLDPKGANNHIKDAIDRRYVTDEDEDPSADSSLLLMDTPLSGSLSTDASIMDSDEAQQQLHANESDDSL